MKSLKIHKAANGHASIDFDEYDSPAWFKIVSILEDEMGFIREGDAAMGMDEGIMPSFVKNDITISAGWDNWSGNYLLSESKEADEVLAKLISQLSGTKQ
ncbi:hypothetical protein AMS58_21080 [Pseudoalteromonas porphyrae]|uniref:hypothetical protein n=1 Tax=Pseudoalteromonas TaxID=53246 RepID=UPI0006BA8993|nr:hypothetical protein [Pseudoalteromonas porphyrae]KPH91300.1 hypothetical protein AMS58_21080 [Pseudoalteromonas porphyrae]